MKLPEILTTLAIGAMVTPVLGVSLRACVDKSEAPLKDHEDADAVTHYIGGYYIHEVHPKPGVTCFLSSSNGISCLKD